MKSDQTEQSSSSKDTEWETHDQEKERKHLERAYYKRQKSISASDYQDVSILSSITYTAININAIMHIINDNSNGQILHIVKSWGYIHVCVEY